MVVFVWMNTGVGSVWVPVKLVMPGVAVVVVVVLDGILVVSEAVCVAEELVWVEEVANTELTVDVAYRVHIPSDVR
jgi:hypothetical protein